MENELKPLREGIDRVDVQLLALLNERMRLCREVGRIKGERGLELLDPGREERIYERLTGLNPGPLTDASLRSVYREIFTASRLLQHLLIAGAVRQQNPEKACLPGRLCGCLTDAPLEDLPQILNHPELDMVEWRLDLFAQYRSQGKLLEGLGLLGLRPRHPVLATNRPKEQGGVFEGGELQRIEMLKRAVDAGAEWVDLEDGATKETLEWFREKGTRILLSHHDFTATPDAGALHGIVERMARRGVDAVKIVTFAHNAQDNLRVLELIPFGKREWGVDVLAFCMGPLGRWSRPVSLLLGSPWTYVQLPGRPGSAPGQFIPSEIRALWEALL